jgi:hypothetical protein
MGLGERANNQEDFQDSEGWYGENYPQKSRYLPSRDHAEEDQD